MAMFKLDRMSPKMVKARAMQQATWKRLDKSDHMGNRWACACPSPNALDQIDDRAPGSPTSAL